MRDFKGMKRQRGRNRRSGGGQSGGQSNNPNRSFDSNGPEGIKVRGNAQTVYERYQQLARDATSSGDRILAENYLQHAEHYNRVIMAAQSQMQVQQVRDARDDDQDDDGEDNNFNRSGGGSDYQQPAQQQQQQQRVNGSGPQPVIEGTPAEVALQQQEAQSNRETRGEHANGDGQPEEASADAAPRRPRRPRRSRSKGDEEANEGSSDETPVTEAAQ